MTLSKRSNDIYYLWYLNASVSKRDALIEELPEGLTGPELVRVIQQKGKYTERCAQNMVARLKREKVMELRGKKLYKVSNSQSTGHQGEAKSSVNGQRDGTQRLSGFTDVLRIHVVKKGKNEKHRPDLADSSFTVPPCRASMVKPYGSNRRPLANASRKQRRLNSREKLRSIR
jgi:hypothetical protein